MYLLRKSIDVFVAATIHGCRSSSSYYSTTSFFSSPSSLGSSSSSGLSPPSHSAYYHSLNTNIMDTNHETIKTIVVCGPSGSGKTTLLHMLTNHFKDCFQFCVSHTTRKARNGEEDGNAYYFVDAPTFKQMIAKKEFVEYAEFSGNFYGTSRAELTKVKNSGRIPILDVDLRGVQSLKAIRFDAKYLFITAPTFDSLERNLRKRGSETEDHIEARLRHAKEDMATARQVDFDLVIVNQVVEKAFEQFCAFVQPDVDRLKQLTKC